MYKLFVKQIIRVQDPTLEVIQIKFFTADIKAKVANNDQFATQAQQSYHRALEASYPDKIEIIKGFYSLEKEKLPIYINPPDKSQGAGGKQDQVVLRDVLRETLRKRTFVHAGVRARA